jgi:hypothetical protein
MTMIQHAPQGDPCEKCGQPASKHQKARERKLYFREYEHKRPKRPARDRKDYNKTREKQKRVYPIIGIDGEGVTLEDGQHLYTYLAAVDETGKVWGEKYNALGLSHNECCDVLLGLPRDSLKFGYMISYDMTKILEPLPLVERFYLMRPDQRKRRTCKDCKHSWTVLKKTCPKCSSTNFHEITMNVYWNGRGYNFQQGSYTFSEGRDEKAKKHKWKHTVKIWDCFRFFQCSFVDALKNWNVGTEAERAQIQSMKIQRGTFIENDPKEVQQYCKHECRLLAVMMRAVLDAHEEVELDLAGQFQGAGATASALLKKHDVAEYKTPSFDSFEPEFMQAIMSSFFGGRFENSIVGLIEQPIYGRDIASAYPYAETFLPCLKCGRWEHVSGKGLMRAIEKASLACCHYRVGAVDERTRKRTAWLPLPFRDDKGSICYPYNCTGWAWKPEMMSALAGWGNHIEVTEAWIYHKVCVHQPFGFIPEVYRNRIKWGKEGKGIVLKLGANATYGKTAQNVGKKPFNDWIWAGNTTAITRGMINDLICLAKDPWNVLSIATDGIYAAENIDCPKPVDTDTNGLLDNKGKPKEPLGGWEPKDVPDGVFIAKPGLYYSLAKDLEQKDVRARGIGRRDTFEQREKLINGFLAWDRKDYEYFVALETRRFFGIKHSIYAISRCTPCGETWVGSPRKCCPECGRIADHFVVKEMLKNEGPSYGRWFDLEAKIRFDPRPKRERDLDPTGRNSRLYVRDMGGLASKVYLAGMTTPEGEASRMAQELAEEQPDVIEE